MEVTFKKGDRIRIKPDMQELFYRPIKPGKFVRYVKPYRLSPKKLVVKQYGNKNESTWPANLWEIDD